MKAYIFPGQGSQFPGMGKTLYEESQEARNYFEKANELLGFRISDIMFKGSEEEIKQTRVTQPAIFLHSVILAKGMKENFQPDMVAGHSLGEFSALVAVGSLSFEEGLKLVATRAGAMQKACEATHSTMAAIIGLDDEIVENVCREIDDIVVPANYNCPGQLVISGTIDGVNRACEALKTTGARMAIMLNVGGAFHSPLMEPARAELAAAIDATHFNKPICPVYQNVNAKAVSDPDELKRNLILQLTAPVKWMQSVMAMIHDGADEFIEVGPGMVLKKLVQKISRKVKVINY